MKPSRKQYLSAFVAILLVLALVIPCAPNAAAVENEYEYTDPYVLSYKQSDIPASYQEFAKPYFYTSPHLPLLYAFVNGNSTPAMDSVVSVFNLINTSEIGSETASTPYASTPAYCVDFLTSTVSNYMYQRLNLDNATHFDTETSQKIRAIYTHSFPYLTLDELRTASGISSLTGAEAITATQFTIWMYANRDSDCILSNSTHDPIDTDGSDPHFFTLSSEEIYRTDYQNKQLYPDSPVNWLESESENTSDNIETLVEYLKNVSPEAANKVVITNDSIQNITVSVKEAENGTYTITASCNIAATIDSQDRLVLTANCSGQQQNVRLTEAGTFRFTFTGCETPSGVDFEINGTQVGNDVYLFEAYGGREKSQSMIGHDTSVLPVHAEASSPLETDKVLFIHKYTPTSESDIPGDGTETEIVGRYPLKDIVFDIYLVGTMSEVFKGEVEYSRIPTDEEIARYLIHDNLVGTVITNDEGNATYNFTANGQPDGLYLIVERDSDLVINPVDPFYVFIPMTNPTGDGLLNHIHVYPKNDSVPTPETTEKLQIVKYDAEDSSMLLRDATFSLARKATHDETYDIVIDGLDYVFVPFYITANLSGNPVYKVTTDENGIAIMYGLTVGEYYLVEISAPPGYNLLDAPLPVSISYSGGNFACTIKVENHAGTKLPETGGIGTTIFTEFGVLLILLFTILFFTGRRKNQFR